MGDFPTAVHVVRQILRKADSCSRVRSVSNSPSRYVWYLKKASLSVLETWFSGSIHGCEGSSARTSQAGNMDWDTLGEETVATQPRF